MVKGYHGEALQRTKRMMEGKQGCESHGGTQRYPSKGIFSGAVGGDGTSSKTCYCSLCCLYLFSLNEG